jgi:hypothetical protein
LHFGVIPKSCAVNEVVTSRLHSSVDKLAPTTATVDGTLQTAPESTTMYKISTVSETLRSRYPQKCILITDDKFRHIANDVTDQPS